MNRAVLLLILAGMASNLSGAENIDRLLDSGRIGRAREVTEKIPDGADRHYWLAKIAFYCGEYAAAGNEMRQALAGSQKPEWRDLAAFFEAVDSVSRGYREFTSPHFILHTRGIDAILAAQALDTLEKAYAEIGGDLGQCPDGRVLVEVYPDKDAFALASTLGTSIVEKSGTVGICKFDRLMILSPRALPLGYAWCDTLAHEYTHLLVARISAGGCPLWLHEGIARYQETRWRLSEPEFLGAAGKNELAAARKDNKLIPFKRMHPSLVFLKDQREISLAFAEVSSCVDFMKKECGPDVLRKLLPEMAFRNESDAVKRVTGISLDALEKKWRAYVGTIPIDAAPGALSDQPDFARKTEDEFIGQDLKGQIRLGDEMRKIGRPDGALVHYRKALVVEPANPVILLKIARACRALGDTATAKERLLQAIEKNPNYVTPYQTLGELYCNEGKYADAAETLAAAVRINPFHPDTHRLLARSYLALEGQEAAIAEMRIVAQLDPSDSETRLLLERLKP